MMHICVNKLSIIGSDDGLSPGRRQAIIWTNAGILLIGPLGTNCSETLSEIHKFSFKKMHVKMSSGKWRPFCLGLNVRRLKWWQQKVWRKWHVTLYRVSSENLTDWEKNKYDIDGLVQACSNSSASAMELLQSCIKPSICHLRKILKYISEQQIFVFLFNFLFGVYSISIYILHHSSTNIPTSIDSMRLQVSLSDINHLLDINWSSTPILIYKYSTGHEI